MPSTLLVVDDEPTARAYAANVLRRAGYDVLEAASGEEALRIAADPPARIDLLVTDFHMPGMNGDELALRLLETRPSLPVLIVSGSWPGGDERFPVVTKPFRGGELVDKVRELLTSP